MAATAGQLETVEALLDRGCDANVQDFVSLFVSKFIFLTANNINMSRLVTQPYREQQEAVT